jgi:predicted short-subunit dehydrogenase-like oxidoreductase (DUF2520 family)
MDNDASIVTGGQFGLIGAGKVGTVLAAAMMRAGYALTHICEPAESAIAASRNFLGMVPLARSLSDVVISSKLALIAVPDDRLKSLVGALAAQDISWRGRTVVHVSGRYGHRILGPLETLGANCLAIHPAMAFAGDPQTDLDRVPGARFAVSGSDMATHEWGVSLVLSIGGVPLSIAEEERVLYHAALAHGSNHLVTLVIQATEMLLAAGVAEPASLLRPLLRAALENALQRGAAGATGPVVRGDAGTVSAHLSNCLAVFPAQSRHIAHYPLPRCQSRRSPGGFLRNNRQR